MWVLHIEELIQLVNDEGGNLDKRGRFNHKKIISFAKKQRLN